MWLIATKRLLLFLMTIMVWLSLASCESFPEASFELAPESRLPKWLTLPPDLSRTDVTVTMNYYVKPSGRSATFILRNLKQGVLLEIKGIMRGLEPLKLKNQKPGFPSGYPLYEIITVDGATEIIEHRRMEPIFYVVDDPLVVDELIGSNQRKTQ